MASHPWPALLPGGLVPRPWGRDEGGGVVARVGGEAPGECESRALGGRHRG